MVVTTRTVLFRYLREQLLFVYFPVGGMAMSTVCHIFRLQLMAAHLQEAEWQEEADRRNHLIFMQSAIGKISIKADRRNHLILMQSAIGKISIKVQAESSHLYAICYR